MVEHELRDGEFLLDLGSSSDEDGSESRRKMPVDVAMEELEKGGREKKKKRAERKRISQESTRVVFFCLKAFRETKLTQAPGLSALNWMAVDPPGGIMTVSRWKGLLEEDERELVNLWRIERRKEIRATDSHLSFNSGRVDLGIIGLDVPRSMNELELVTVEMD